MKNKLWKTMLELEAGRNMVLLFIIMIGSVVMTSIYLSMKGKIKVNVRSLAPLDAIREGVGRAAEMNRPVIFTDGWSTFSGGSIPICVAAYSVLGYMSTFVAQNNANLIVTTCKPEALPLMQDSVRNGYVLSGELETYESQKDKMFEFYPRYSYTTATPGLMERIKPALFVYMGPQAHESIIFGETCRHVGAMGIAGSVSIMQLPFLIATHDYVLIGEELYAASAYISQEAVPLGSLYGQDIMRILLISLMAIGIVLRIFGINIIPILKM